MTELFALIKRNCKLFFKDKGMFFTSLITPFILLVLYTTFLAGIYRSSFESSVAAAGVTVSPEIINATVAGQLVSSLLAVSTVTVAFCSNLLMVQDKVSGARKDLLVTPVKRSLIAVGYFVSSALVTLIITLGALAGCLIYVAACGWFMSFTDVILTILDVILLTLFGTALSSVIYFSLTTNGQASAVGTIVSAGYGFVCGAYFPINQIDSAFLKNFFSFLPGTYGTSLIRNHSLNGAFNAMSKSGFPAEAVEGIKASLDCNLQFFGKDVSMLAAYLVLIGSVVLFTGIYVLLNVIHLKKTTKKTASFTA